MAPFCCEKASDIASIREGISKHRCRVTNEIVDELARKICKDLDIPFVR